MFRTAAKLEKRFRVYQLAGDMFSTNLRRQMNKFKSNQQRLEARGEAPGAAPGKMRIVW